VKSIFFVKIYRGLPGHAALKKQNPLRADFPAIYIIYKTGSESENPRKKH